MAKIKKTDETVEKLKAFHTADENVKQLSHSGKQSMSPSKCYTELPYDPAMPLLGIYPRERKTYIHIKSCTLMFVVVLFIISQKVETPLTIN